MKQTREQKRKAKERERKKKFRHLRNTRQMWNYYQSKYTARRKPAPAPAGKRERWWQKVLKWIRAIVVRPKLKPKDVMEEEIEEENLEEDQEETSETPEEDEE